MKKPLIFLSVTALAVALLTPVSGANALTSADCNRVTFNYSYNVEPYTARAGQSVAVGTNATAAECRALNDQHQANVTYGQAGNGEFNFTVIGEEVGTTPCQYDVYVNGRLWVSGQTTYAQGTPSVQQSDVNITKLNRTKLRTLLQVGTNELRVIPNCPSYPAANSATLIASLYTPDPSYTNTPGVSIEDGRFFATKRNVTVYLSFDDRIAQYAISNYADFRNSGTRVANYKHNDVQWTLLPSYVGLTTKTVYVKYRYYSDSEGLVPGAWSDTVYTDKIVLDDVGPKITKTSVRSVTGLWDINMAVGTAKTKLRQITISANDLAADVDKLQVSFEKSDKGAKTLTFNGSVTVLLPTRISHVHMRVSDINGNWGPWKFVRTR